MSHKTEELLFNSEYEFDVTVEYESERFAGKLLLKKDVVHLIVSGEIGEGSRRLLPWGHLARVECHDFNSRISLFDLRFMSGTSRTISRNPPKGFFENKYEVGFVLFSKTQVGRHRSFGGIKIYSNTISRWLGNTKKQEGIINLYMSGALFESSDDHFLEFSCSIPEMGDVGVSYNPNIFHYSPEFKAGITFPPSLFFRFGCESSVEYALQLTTDMISFFKFITGGVVEIEKIEFLTYRGAHSKAATLFFPRSDTDRRKNNYIFFPLGRNLRFDTLGLPQFPIGAIEKFFSQNTRQINFFRQYLKYRDMISDEERFLGFFRLLEALAHKEGKYLDEAVLLEVISRSKLYLERKFGDKKSVASFIRRIPRWNSSKYNAEKCIIDLLGGVPISISGEWKYGSKDIRVICKLRNDITHANDYEASTTTVSGYAKFVETLVVYSLLIQIGVEETSAATILSRLSGYHEIMKI